MANSDPRPTCFIAMPITTHSDTVERFGGDTAHWDHVIETIFVPAIEAAGFVPVRPSVRGTDLIHGEIIRQLSSADMVLCDLSDHNPNVFFELGVRTSVNKPIALVRDEHTELPFDTSNLNTHRYKSTLNAWDTSSEVEKLKTHIEDSVATCKGENPLWRHFGLTITASQPEVTESSADAKLELIWEGLRDLRRDFTSAGNASAHTDQLNKQQVQRERDVAHEVARVLGVKQYKLQTGFEGADLRLIFPHTPHGIELVDKITEAASWHAFELKHASLAADSLVLLFEDHDPKR
ncbi:MULTISPECIES: hypothetical protein [unclassified Microbacterium]|uniref:hypothetical protein n=1 Tax=unclassified Microbacterium TaxID=2609290 RepID=UPI00068FF1F0|nr:MULTISPECIES: hypothetical protein [unclassified Microbacterium]